MASPLPPIPGAGRITASSGAGCARPNIRLAFELVALATHELHEGEAASLPSTTEYHDRILSLAVALESSTISRAQRTTAADFAAYWSRDLAAALDNEMHASAASAAHRVRLFALATAEDVETSA